MTTNLLLDFYQKNKVSPVHQNIGDIKSHLKRRENLYRVLGLPLSFFRGSNVLEVGPGGGYNALTLLMWDAKLDLVEPNETGASELVANFENHGFGRNLYRLYLEEIQNFRNDKQYDIVLAEGFLPGIINRSSIIDKLKRLVRPGGVIVVTCIDETSFFFENLRRILAFNLTRESTSAEEKIEILQDTFKSHFNALKHTTRPLRDWVMDQFICPTFYGDMFSVEACFQEFGPEFLPLGSSPQFSQDINWYKDLYTDRTQIFIDQFKAKRHILLHWQLGMVERKKKWNNEVFENAAAKLRKLFNELTENAYSQKLDLSLFEEPLRSILNICEDLGKRVTDPINEVLILIKDQKITVDKVQTMNSFASAFGRGMQYVSLTKRSC